MTIQTIALKTKVQAAIYTAVLVPELTKGHWKDARFNGAQQEFAEAKVVVDEKAPGFVGEPTFTQFDLLNKDAVTSMLNRAQKAKITLDDGTKIDARALRAQLKDMMFQMRTPKGKPLAGSHQGMMGTHRGRPSKELIAQVVGGKAPAKARATKTTKAPAKGQGRGSRKAA